MKNKRDIFDKSKDEIELEEIMDICQDIFPDAVVKEIKPKLKQVIKEENEK